MKRIAIGNLMNLRDLGGYPIVGGGNTRYGVFLRSDAPISLTNEDKQKLLEMGIRDTIDLRSQEETEKQPSSLNHVSDFSYHHCPLSGYFQFFTSEDEIPHSYMEFVERKDTVKNIMLIVANAPNGVLYHCAVGKDRTGVISAILLLLAGVGVDDILADYQVSYTYIRQWVEKRHEEYPSMPAWVGQSKIEYMDKFIKLFHQKYNSVQDYLLETGLHRAEIEKIRTKLQNND